jgi:hypothetical protein
MSKPPSDEVAESNVTGAMFSAMRLINGDSKWAEIRRFMALEILRWRARSASSQSGRSDSALNFAGMPRSFFAALTRLVVTET